MSAPVNVEAIEDAEGVEAVPAPPTWPRIVTLKHPIKFGSETITSLEFRRGQLRDMKGIKLRDDLPADDLTLIASRMCGQTTNALGLIDIEDAGEVTDIALDFYKAYLGAGRKR